MLKRLNLLQIMARRAVRLRGSLGALLATAFFTLLCSAPALAQTGIRLEAAAWVPAMDATYGWWGVTAPGADPDDRQHWSTGRFDEPLPVPPGTYDVYWVQAYATSDVPMLLAEGVVVADGRTAVVHADAGLQIAAADWVPSMDATYGWWGVTEPGDDPDKPINWSTGRFDVPLLLPPGSYDVYWVQEYATSDEPMLIAEGVAVEAGKLGTIAANAGLRIAAADWVPAMDATYGWWGVTEPGDDPDKPINWSKGRFDLPLMMPPGSYDVYWVQDYPTSDEPMLIAEGVEVKAATLGSIAVDSGLQIAAADWVPAMDETYGWWGVTESGDEPGERTAWSKGRFDVPLMMPPGSYDVYWVQDYPTSGEPMLIAEGVEVKAATLGSIAVDSGLQIAAADWVPAMDETYGWWGVTESGDEPGERIAWSKGRFDVPLMQPPGTYDVYWVQDYPTSGEPMLIAEGIAVEAGKLGTISADAGIGLKVAADTPAMDETYGWWGVTEPGADADDRINWSEGRFDLPLMLPPGSYDIYWRQDFESEAERRAEGISVAAGELVAVDLASGGATVTTETPAATGGAPAASVLTSVSLAAQEFDGAGTDFPLGTLRVDATYVWRDAPDGLRVDIRWLQDGSVVLEQNETLNQAAGESSWYMAMQGAEPLPAGNYQVQILENGLALAPAATFTIAATGPDAQGESAPPPPATGAALAGELLASDDFDDPSSGWQPRKATGVEAGYREGHYRVALAAAPNLLAMVAQEREPLGDVIIEVDATPEEGSPPHPFGLFVRSQDETNFHAFMIASDGSFAAVRLVDGNMALDSELTSRTPDGTLSPAGEANHLKLVADGATLSFYVNGTLVIEIADANWPAGQAGLFVATTGGAAVAVSFDNWRVWRIARESADMTPAPEINESGYPQFTMSGFTLQETRQIDASPAIEGAETTLEFFVSASGDQIHRYAVGGTIWAYAWLPGGLAEYGYVLRDPDCDGVATEKWPTTGTISAPDCAVGVSGGETSAVDFSIYAPTDPGAAIKEVALGDADAAAEGFDASRAGTTFELGTSQVIVWFRFAGAPTNEPLAAQWYRGEDFLFASELIPEQPDGNAWWGLFYQDYLPLAAGTYRVELTEGGTKVASIPFEIVAPEGESAPFGGRGWDREADGVYVNSLHDLRLGVPDGWKIADELRWPGRYLWAMGKPTPDAASRLDMVLMRRMDRDFASVEELFDDELAGLKASTVEIDGVTQPFSTILSAGPTANADIYETVEELTQDKRHVRLFFFVREGVGYIASFRARADATPEEKAELDGVRQSMGL